MDEVLSQSQNNQLQLSLVVKRVANQIEKADRVESQYINEGGEASRLYMKFETLVAKASPNELSALTDDQNPSVRVYTFMGLVQRDAFGNRPSRF